MRAALGCLLAMVVASSAASAGSRTRAGGRRAARSAKRPSLITVGEVNSQSARFVIGHIARAQKFEHAVEIATGLLPAVGTAAERIAILDQLATMFDVDRRPAADREKVQWLREQHQGERSSVEGIEASLRLRMRSMVGEDVTSLANKRLVRQGAEAQRRVQHLITTLKDEADLYSYIAQEIVSIGEPDFEVVKQDFARLTGKTRSLQGTRYARVFTSESIEVLAQLRFLAEEIHRRNPGAVWMAKEALYLVAHAALDQGSLARWLTLTNAYIANTDDATLDRALAEILELRRTLGNIPDGMHAVISSEAAFFEDLVMKPSFDIRVYQGRQVSFLTEVKFAATFHDVHDVKHLVKSAVQKIKKAAGDAKNPLSKPEVHKFLTLQTFWQDEIELIETRGALKRYFYPTGHVVSVVEQSGQPPRTVKDVNLFRELATYLGELEGTGELSSVTVSDLRGRVHAHYMKRDFAVANGATLHADDPGKGTWALLAPQ